MALTIESEHHWPPEVVDALFLDDNDHKGLVRHYEIIDEKIKSLKTK